ncbi:protein phosphatase regulator [Conoideocrella luteorostrata]|uniref:Protein phosphatase regulator n=1 Tax=Conoideocrella luteorostrata TaxID=1105319 RepID=A0AAJ0CNJ0_9HYPO|nr:protein phosphatase regulator [Conoideocrella luteorostrata]
MANDDQSTPSRDELVQQIVGMCNITPEKAIQYLEANQWDLIAACNSYFQDDDEEKMQGESSSTVPESEYTGPRTLDGRPAPPSASSSRGRSQPKSQPKRKGVATLGSLGGGHQHDDDADDDDEADEANDNDGRGNLFAGGEKSGLAVQDPSQDGGPRKIISDILAKAKANASRPATNSDDPVSSGPSRFRGAGITLGGEGIESRSIPDPHGGPDPTNIITQERVLHIWQDGFSIDDGELRRFDDPANQTDLQMIRSGRAPLHLMNVQQDQPVDVKLHQHETPYKPQPKKYKPFAGSGQRLGSPVPGAGSVSSAPAPAAAPISSTASSTQEPVIDSAQPTVMIRIQLPDGARLPARFNTTSTIGDIYGFVQGASPETISRSWVLATTFPNKEHTDKGLVLGDMPEFKKGGTAVVKWV